ncbi:RHS repeat-associated core domain-containing protein [Massilia sp. W12]|uniref:RHS repeat domain-containing protein n=1 Tax=Massilia sp. W12 TaxID=3126507 RepID=UPI0030CD8D56
MAASSTACSMVPAERVKVVVAKNRLRNHALATLQDGALYWYHCDQIGTPQELTDAQGRVVWAAQYQVWGEAEMLQTGTGSAWQYSEPLPQVEQPFRFQGQQYDAETGLHYNRFRYYDPAIGRFISQDPIGLLGGSNLFAYADNPIDWIDPLGLSVGRKPKTGKPNIDNRCEDCEKWKLDRFDRSCEGHVPGVGNAKYFRDPKDGRWYSVDKTGHGESAFKQFRQEGNKLVHIYDLDEFGDRMGKHKGEAGKTIDLKTLKCKDAK